ncbi:GNAT family N-acetyltransferase [Zavarzinella formosa]|uniref:GNAT family N-acetyltransferase n=1 Tax=Zavarzinella formosa TaxID=360055 RepID=UPI00031F1C8A|nr:GNAT family N-acetyltransferase [Zavarzinella formosa]
MTSGRLTPPTPITDGHDVDTFDCGVVTLNDWLKKRAVKNDLSGASRTYVLREDEVVIGYYCLSTGAVDHDDAPGFLRRNMPDPIPVLVLGRLAVDRRHQNRGIGHALLRDVVRRALQVAEMAGVVAVLVHALSEPARCFYQSCGFVEMPSQPTTLFLMLHTAHQTGVLPLRNG